MRLLWSEENIVQLRSRFEKGESLESIAGFVGTTRRAVQVKLNRLGLGIHASRSRTTRVCVGCGKEEVITFTRAKESKFCSRKCWDNNRPTGPRKNKVHGQCLNCGSQIRRSGKYCNNTCLALHRNSILLKRWMDGESDLARCENGCLATFARNHLIGEAGGKCSQCGWKEVNPVTRKVPLTVDHTDGNSDNTHPSNLKVLCPNCHSLTPTYGGLNKGNGRKMRQAKRVSMRE
jgi:5-methylcytosine-specific restriction endonuclease McrA